MQTTIQSKTRLALAMGAILITAGVCAAQNDAKPAEPLKFFHLNFVVKELDSGKVINSRSYATTISTAGSFGDFANIRTGNKVPVATGGSSGSGQYTYIDVGVSIDARSAKEIDGSLALNVVAEISNAATSTTPPMIRQTKWQSNVIVPIGKPTTVFSSDDVTTKGQMQLELTATPIAAH